MKKLAKRLAVLLIFGAAVFSLAACGSGKVPTAEEFLNYTMEEELEFAADTSAKALLDKWGEPQIVNQQRIWTVPLDGETKYISAWFDGDKVISVHASDILYVTVAAVKANVAYCLTGWEDYSTDIGNLTFMPPRTCFGEEIVCEPGDQFIFEFDGLIMEGYPAQLNAPYSATRTGRLTDAEIKTLADAIVWP